MKKLTMGILAHVDSGKTTFSESLLYVCGSIRKAGRVDHGDSTLDTNEIERSRGITVFSKQAVLNLRDMHIDRHILGQIMEIGLPAGFQGIVFSLSNVLIQSSINSFGSTVVAGSAASANIENFVYQAMNAFYQTNLTFTGQNYGAGECKRVDKSLIYCQTFVIITGVVLGNLAYLFGHPLVSIYAPGEEDVIQQGIIRLGYIARTYALCGIMDTMVGSLRGLGYSVGPMIVSLIGACGLRIVWIFTIFQVDRTPENLYISYPISWIVTGAVHIIFFLVVRKKAFALVRANSHKEVEGAHPEVSKS